MLVQDPTGGREEDGRKRGRRTDCVFVLRGAPAEKQKEDTGTPLCRWTTNIETYGKGRKELPCASVEPGGQSVVHGARGCRCAYSRREGKKPWGGNYKRAILQQ